MINDFIDDYHKLTRPVIVEEYDNMDSQRLKIKNLLDIQGSEVHRHGNRRKNIYYAQLAKFKYWYVRWKNNTYYIFLNVRYGIPLHLESALKYYLEVSHNISSTIYML